MGEHATDTERSVSETEVFDAQAPKITLIISAFFGESKTPATVPKQKRAFGFGLWIAVILSVAVFSAPLLHHARKAISQNSPAVNLVAVPLPTPPMEFFTRNARRFVRTAKVVELASPLAMLAIGPRPRALPERAKLSSATRIQAATPAPRSRRRSEVSPRLYLPPRLLVANVANSHVKLGSGTTLCLFAVHTRLLSVSDIGVFKPDTLACRKLAPLANTTYVITMIGLRGERLQERFAVKVDSNPEAGFTR